MASERCEPSQSSDLVVYNGDKQDETKDYTMGLAMAHVSVQAQGIAASQLQLHTSISRSWHNNSSCTLRREFSRRELKRVSTPPTYRVGGCLQDIDILLQLLSHSHIL
ncbi:hypothetical protein V7S43_005380 [Phytophthora oleae]|uniref:Uncharacterized protein n=1 Tax=Phytophthora oleae TaxID=2107226 RepID=A0ABD3FT05_9STRA